MDKCREYFESIKDADDYIRTLPKDKTRYTYEVMKYDLHSEKAI